MGLYFRKSIKINKYLRLNISKTGVSMSATIPGTGLRYSTPKIGGLKLEKEKAQNSRTSASRQNNTSLPYTQTVSNEYTGESRTLRASTEWELQNMVENETARQTQNEYRQRRIDNQTTLTETANEQTRQQVESRTRILNILEDTLSVDDKLDWSKQEMNPNYKEFEFSENPPEKPAEKKFSFFKKNDGEEEKYQTELNEYNKRKDLAKRQYLIDKDEYERKARGINAEIQFLRENFENSEESAVEKYISIILANSKYPEDIDIDFDTKYKRAKRTLQIDCLMPSVETLPIVDSFVFNERINGIDEIAMPEYELKAFYERTLFNIAIRTIHEMFESIYTDGVNTIVFNAFILNDDIPDDSYIDDFEDCTHCIFTISAERSIFTSIDLSGKNSVAVASFLNTNKISDFLSSNENVAPIKV